MKQERTIKELLQLMLDNQSLFKVGLCHWKSKLCRKSLITFGENLSLGIFIHNNRPSKYSSLDAYLHRNKSVFWKPCNIKPRIKWIKKNIEKL